MLYSMVFGCIETLAQVEGCFVLTRTFNIQQNIYRKLFQIFESIMYWCHFWRVFFFLVRTRMATQEDDE